MDWKSFLIGLAVGAVIALVALFWQLAKRSKEKSVHKAETEKLRTMLNDRMDLESNGLSSLKVELEKLRKENENLRVTVNSLSQKPGRKEVQRLQVYQDAVDKLIISSPGFGAAWHTSLKEAESEMDKTYAGTLPFFKKVIPQKSAAPTIDLVEADRNDKN
ncbi:MAG: hypothetical protein ACQGQO_02040 [Sphaerochaetaceae bacterium]|jgi:gas vesicle protein